MTEFKEYELAGLDSVTVGIEEAGKYLYLDRESGKGVQVELSEKQFRWLTDEYDLVQVDE